MKKAAAGFTLVELLVVITIMAVTGIFAFANFGSFGEEQKLKNAALDIQSLLRTAQTNAVTNVICNTQGAANWQVEFLADKKTINLWCKETSDSASTLKKTLSLETNIEIELAASSFGARADEPVTVCPKSAPILTFTPLNNKIDLGGKDSKGASISKFSCDKLIFKLTNTKTGSTKDLIIERGGRVYVQ